MKKKTFKASKQKNQLPWQEQKNYTWHQTLKTTHKVSNNKFKGGKFKPWILYPMLLNLRYQGYRKPVSYRLELRKFFTHSPLEKSTSVQASSNQEMDASAKGLINFQQVGKIQ